MPVWGNLYESESRLTAEAGWATYHCWMEDVERLDEMIGQYLPIALSAEQDFDRALRAAYVMIELIGIQIALLEFYFGNVQ